MEEQARHAYKPSAWGELFHSLKVDEALGGGSAGPGKTTALLADPLEQIVVEHKRCQLPKNHPDYHPWGDSTGWALHLRRTLTMLDQTIVKANRMFRAIDSGLHWDAAHLIFRFSSGYRFQFGHCKDRDSYYNYYSSEFTHLGFDELVQFLAVQYEQLKTRVRSSDHVLRKMLKTRAMTNPALTYEGQDFSVDNPYWVREYFVDPYKRLPGFNRVPTSAKDTAVIVSKVEMADGSSERLTRLFLPAKLTDNPDPGFAKDYERNLRGKSKHLQLALLHGDWYAVAGAFYSDVWNPTLHICEPFRIPSGWYRFRSMDWGFKKHGCIGWYAIDPDGTLWKEKEYSFRLKTDVEVSKEVKRIERELGLWKNGRSLISGPADTQLWEERGESARTKAQVFADAGIEWEKADKKSRAANAQRLLKRLGDHHHGTTTPGIVFFRTCVQTITTVPAIPTDPKDSECPMDGGADHWHDETLYACAHASLHEGAGRDEEDDDEEDEEEFEAEDWGRAYGTA